VNSESEGEGDNLDENLEEDYKPKPELDKYEGEGIDDED
jgi:DNA replication licensing factor MCM2